jgi:3-hydroxyacyl-[acyl-carrier-protein] dehydratase
MTLPSWTVAADDAVFAGHFPGRPIVPGVLLVDFAVRCLAIESRAVGPHWRVANAKFPSGARPGDILSCSLKTRPNGSVDFQIHSADRLVAAGAIEPLI